MNKVLMNVKAFLKDEEGLTVVEYVVGAGLLVAGLTGIFATFSSTLETQLTGVFSSGS
ncbi:Flp family type IVb pilin [Vibrio coralliilyticus]|uniref:Fimbrial protein n=1 Tax=Vibrio coralliilyticus TaxID=190893 RepID=A0AAN0SBF3_9VIBR|nr:fimbrial protein [Vibrio coralliilyticus]AIW17936.1 fimbrial protein [Vibrio coralliilyticus]MCC2522897.1 Flp family type IVb pilin [Vibrio coralliilyticus]NOH37071.1 Flp family type IVb pilin [Vibrio coralliilyticus]NOI56285.1 Flp family type IVb pilin [Vibrio coralliilyticus]NRF62918.1 Flp family type IVb pilin [Vibrio coralliilyticus]